MVKAMQKEGKNPLLYSSAFGEPRINALGRRYKLGKASGSKYYEQSNGSWSLNLPKVSLTPGSAEVVVGNARAESSGPEIEAPAIEAPAIEAPAMNGKDPLSRPPQRPSPPAAPAIEAPAEQILNGKDPRSRPRPRIQRVVSQPVEQMWNDSDPDPISRSMKKIKYCEKYGCNRGRRNSNSSRKSRRRRASRKHRRTYRK